MSENNTSSTKATADGSAWGRFWSRFVREPETSIEHEIYGYLVRHARFPLFYDRLGVPDTPEGRFEILALHTGLTVRRLSALDGEGRNLSQRLFDLMVADLDMNMRELGVGDLSVGKQVKRLASQFYARLAVLNQAFDQGRTDALAPMLRTNVYGGIKASSEQVDHLAAIISALHGALAETAPDELKAGRLTLPDEAALKALA